MPLRTANIIGSGPNGLAAAITLAQRGVAVTVFERNSQPGGACSTAEVTLPGFRHDLGSSVYPLGIASPFFRTLPLEQHGLRWIHPDAPLAHPFDDGSAITLESTLEATLAQFATRLDQAKWRSTFSALIEHWQDYLEDLMAPLLRVPSHPLRMALFGAVALQPARNIARFFPSPQVQALFAGNAAHGVLPFTAWGSGAAGLVLAAAGHTTGWPVAAGGAQSLTSALVAYLESLGGRVVCDHPVASLRDIPPADITLFDTTSRTMLSIAGDALSASYRRAVDSFQPGPGTVKIDFALSGPIPWRSPQCLRAATVHLGGSLEEIALSEHLMSTDQLAERPYVLLTQPSLFDASRAPAGRHTAWAYCHAPRGLDAASTALMASRIEQQIERFAPGFREVVLARRVWGAADLEAWNPSLTGGDITGGAMNLRQLIARPTLRSYRTSNRALYLCSASTPPGGGVHGMCGHHAALASLADHR